MAAERFVLLDRLHEYRRARIIDPRADLRPVGPPDLPAEVADQPGLVVERGRLDAEPTQRPAHELDRSDRDRLGLDGDDVRGHLLPVEEANLVAPLVETLPGVESVRVDEFP